MLKPKSPQESFFGSYLYDRIVPVDHVLRKINQVVDLSFAKDILKDRYNQTVGRPPSPRPYRIRTSGTCGPLSLALPCIQPLRSLLCLSCPLGPSLTP